MKKLYLIVVVLCFLACAPHAHATSCTGTAVAGTNLTCQAATFANTNYCEPSGFAVNGVATAQVGDLFILWTGMGGPQTSVSVTGNLGTGTWSVVP